MKKFTIELDENAAENLFKSLDRLSWDLDTELIDIELRTEDKIVKKSSWNIDTEQLDVEYQVKKGQEKAWSEFIGDYTYPLKERHTVVKEQKDIIDDVVTQLLVQLPKPKE